MLRTFISEGPDPQVVVCVGRSEHRITAEVTLEVVNDILYQLGGRTGIIRPGSLAYAFNRVWQPAAGLNLAFNLISEAEAALDLRSQHTDDPHTTRTMRETTASY